MGGAPNSIREKAFEVAILEGGCNDAPKATSFTIIAAHFHKTSICRHVRSTRAEGLATTSEGIVCGVRVIQAVPAKEDMFLIRAAENLRRNCSIRLTQKAISIRPLGQRKIAPTIGMGRRLLTFFLPAAA